jgi:hypothetical protein
LEAAAPSLPWPAAASAARRDVVYEENGNDYVQGEEENRGGPQCFFSNFLLIILFLKIVKSD